MIHFMLYAHRQQFLGLEFEGLTVMIERPDPDTLGTFDVLVDARHGQTSFLADLGALARDDFGVDQGQQAIPVFGHVDHDDPLVNVHLGGCEPDARCRVHGVSHVLDELADGMVDHSHRTGLGMQPRIGIFQDGQPGHNYLRIE
jgi:hypothetical protein